MIVTLPGQLWFHHMHTGPPNSAELKHCQNRWEGGLWRWDLMHWLSLHGWSFTIQKKSTINSVAIHGNGQESAELRLGVCTLVSKGSPGNGSAHLRVNHHTPLPASWELKAILAFTKKNRYIKFYIICEKMEGYIQGFILFYATQQQKLLVWCSYLSL